MAVDLLDAGDLEGLRRHLRQHPDLVHERVSFPEGNYFRNPSLLEFVAENPVRCGVLPANILHLAKTILDNGAKRDPSALNGALGLVASGRVARECGVQVPLIDLLCDYGADPEGALKAALAHGEFAAGDALIARGAEPTLLVTAAKGLVDEFRRLLPSAGGEDRHCALALASQFGHAGIVQVLLESGEDPNRYNPSGFHGHSTPLHQAAAAGHMEVVRVLIEYGAKPDRKDTLWRATPAEWAQYESQPQVEQYLRKAAHG